MRPADGDGRPRAAVVGAGPVGLDAALALVDAGWSVRVHEAGPEVGTHVRAWGHVRLFTPWSMAVSARMRAHLGGAAPDGDTDPTGHELVDRLLLPLSRVPALEGVVRTGSAVTGVARRGLLKHEAIGDGTREGRPFRLLVADTGTGGEHSEDADLVVDASGTYGRANALGDGGVAAAGELAVPDRITRHLPDTTVDPGRWTGRRVLLVGAGKSAQTAARDLAALAPATTTCWLVRDADPDWGEVPDDTLPGRQELVDVARALRAGAVEGVVVRTGAHVEALRRVDGIDGRPDGAVAVTVRGPGGEDEVVVDDVVALTGYAPDTALYAQLQVHECYATAAPMALSAALLAAAGDGPADCLAQPAVGVDALRSPEPDFFVLGAKSYGRNNAFLLRVGYEQVDALAGAYALTRS